MGLCPRLSQLQTASPRVAHLHAPLQLASSSCQYRTTASDQQNRPDQGQPVETPQLGAGLGLAAGLSLNRSVLGPLRTIAASRGLLGISRMYAPSFYCRRIARIEPRVS